MMEDLVERRAKLFMTGRSQAVRLPKEFRFPGTEVRVTKIGDEVVLTPVPIGPFDVEAWLKRLDALGGREAFSDGPAPDAPPPPDPREFVDP
jgi:antitoxin VapB